MPYINHHRTQNYFETEDIDDADAGADADPDVWCNVNYISIFSALYLCYGYHSDCCFCVDIVGDGYQFLLVFILPFEDQTLATYILLVLRWWIHELNSIVASLVL